MNKVKLFFVIIFLVALSTSILYVNRFDIFSTWSPTFSGTFSVNEEAIMGQNINSYFEKHYAKNEKRAYMCEHLFLGRDSKYVYLDLVCGLFKKSLNGEVVTEYGLQVPTRVEYNENSEVLGFDQPKDGTHHFASYSWIFPKEIQRIHRLQKNGKPWNNIHLKALERHQNK